MGVSYCELRSGVSGKAKAFGRMLAVNVRGARLDDSGLSYYCSYTDAGELYFMYISQTDLLFDAVPLATDFCVQDEPLTPEQFGVYS